MEGALTLAMVHTRRSKERSSHIEVLGADKPQLTVQVPSS